MLFALPDRHSSSAIATGSRHNTKKCCRRLHAVGPPRWVGIAISARNVDIPPSLTTRVAIGIAHDARETHVCAGSRHGNENCCLRAMFTSSSPCPRQLAPLALQNKRLIYNLLFHASAETLLEIARDPRHLGADIGFFSVLHTRDQRLQHHPHVHCVVAAGGLAPEQDRWISSRPSFFLPVKVLSRVFRGKFVTVLKAAFRDGKLEFHGQLAPLAQPRVFASWLRVLFRQVGWSTASHRLAVRNTSSATSAPIPTALLSPITD